MKIKTTTLKCLHCEYKILVDNDLIDKIKYCPSCGDTNIVIGGSNKRN